MRLASLFLSAFLIILQPAWAFDHSHAQYDALLEEIVVAHQYQTDVDYRKLKAQSKRLQAYINEIESVGRSNFDSWNPDQQLAFLINAYNALTLELINKHYPEIESIRELGGLIFSSPWDIEFFTLFGEPSTLDHIEHELIRENFAEPRIHFAVNCASRGCPPLQPFAYLPEKLDEQLEYATRQFLQDPERNRYVKDKNRLELSSIFDWYRADFEQAAGSIEKYVAEYITDDPEARKTIYHHAASRRFLDYDWALNSVRGR